MCSPFDIKSISFSTIHKPFFLIVLLTFFVTNLSFGACYTTSNTRTYNLSSISSGSPSCFECPSVYQTSSTSFFYNPTSRLGVGQVDFMPCNQSSVDSYCEQNLGTYLCSCGNSVLCSRQCRYNYYCTTQAEADSCNGVTTELS